MITSDQLIHIMPNSKNIDLYLPIFNDRLPFWKILTNQQMAAFFATIAEESEELNVIEENLNYSATALLATFPTHFSNIETAQAVARKPQQIANIVYANRMGNGNVASGDGWKYRGRGFIQITGLSIYSDYGQATGRRDLILEKPDLLLQPNDAVNSACWFWWSRGVSKYAGNIQEVTRIVNGGLNGIQQREKYYAKALEVFV